MPALRLLRGGEGWVSSVAAQAMRRGVAHGVRGTTPPTPPPTRSILRLGTTTSSTTTSSSPHANGDAKGRSVHPRRRTPIFHSPSRAALPTWERVAIRVKNVDSAQPQQQQQQQGGGGNGNGNRYMDAIRDAHDPAMHLKTIEDELKGTIGQALGKQGRKIQECLRLMQESYDEFQTLVQTHQSDDDNDNDDGDERAAAAAAAAAASTVLPHAGGDYSLFPPVVTTGTHRTQEGGAANALYRNHHQQQQQQQQHRDECKLNNPTMQRARKAAVAHNQYRQQAVTARWELQVHRQAAGFVVDNHNYVMSHYPIPEKLPFDENGNDLVVPVLDNNDNNNNKKSVQKKFGDQLDWWQREGRWK